LVLVAVTVGIKAATGAFSKNPPAVARSTVAGSTAKSSGGRADNQPSKTTHAAPDALAPPAKDNVRELLVGQWRNDKEQGGIAFHKDGTVVMAMPGAAEVKGTYKFLDNNTVEVHVAIGGQQITQKLRVQVSKDELATTDDKNQVDEFTRGMPVAAKPNSSADVKPRPARAEAGGFSTPEAAMAGYVKAMKDLDVKAYKAVLSHDEERLSSNQLILQQGKDPEAAYKDLLKFMRDNEWVEGKYRLFPAEYEGPHRGFIVSIYKWNGPASEPDHYRKYLFTKIDGFWYQSGWSYGIAKKDLDPSKYSWDKGKHSLDQGKPVAPAHKEPISAAETPGLLGYWRLDEGAGTKAADASRNGNDATLHGGKWVGGIKGKAVEFDGARDYLDYGKSPAFNFKAHAPFTFAAWVRTTAGKGPLVSQRNSKDGGPVIDISLADGTLTALVREDGAETGQHAIVTGAAVNDGRWHHVALARDTGTTIELFLDGASQGTASGAQAGGAITTDLRDVACERYWVMKGFPKPYLKGAIDEFCIFDRALSADEINKLAGIARSGPAGGEPAAKPQEVKPPAPANADLAGLRLTLRKGWKVEYNPGSGQWVAEKWTLAPNGLQTRNLLWISGWTGEEPVGMNAFAEKLKQKDWHAIGHVWTKITAKEKLAGGFLIKGMMKDYTNRDARPLFALAMARTINGVKIRAGGQALSDALRKEEIHILETAKLGLAKAAGK
jgi:hypothetical protein